ncbi:hypothetical protein QYM36_016167 [Artemia franciscana]|uniref:Ankyrin repeat protein n=1 Tax=Artemia franciscana TaxID=6661 RepID=A0AA88HBZ3_ARTSF|nr:hypothetical protein QYM36_016167 [Artemia franciscana]
MRDKYDNYSLICAVRQGDLERTKELINSYGLSYSKDWSEESRRDALINGKIEIAKLLSNPRCKVRGMAFDSILHLAVASSNIELVEMILDKGATINKFNKLGETPFHCSIINNDGNVDMTKLLLKYGSDVNARTSYGASPLHLAASEGYSQTVDYLLKNGAHVDCVYTTHTRHNGYTPLHCAAEKGITEVVQLLLDSGANVEAKGEDSKTPVHIAVSNKKETIVKLLLRYGAKVDNQDKNGKTALHLAAEKGTTEVVQLLLDSGANVDAKAKDKNTPLHFAVSNPGNIEIVKLLLNYGCKVSSTLLHSAVSNPGNIEIVKFLLNYGCKVSSTLLHLAVASSDTEVVEMILDKGASINGVNTLGETPLHCAIKNNNKMLI